MRHFLLGTLMTICSLGEEWKDPSKIPVEEIVEERRAQSSKGRYESAMWNAAGLQEPCRRTDKSSGTANDRDDAEGEVDSFAAGGFFGRWGRDTTASGGGEHAGTHLGRTIN